MRDCECIPSVYSLHIRDDLDGVWFYDFEDAMFVLNGSSRYYLYYHSWNFNHIGDWQSTDGLWSAYCPIWVDIANCAGRWIVNDAETGHGWYPESTRTSLFDDCGVTECPMDTKPDSHPKHC